MGNFFKTFGKGILYFITLPLLILFLAVYLVVSIIGFIIVGIKALILFFKGENITGKTAEDIEAEKRIDLWTNPIDHVLKEVEKIKANNETPAISMNPLDSSLNVTGIPNTQPNPQIPQNQYGQLPNNGYPSNNYPNQNNPYYPNQGMNNQVPPQYPNPNQNLGAQNTNQFAPEPEEVIETKHDQFKNPDPNNIVNEEEFNPNKGQYSSINIVPNQTNDNYKQEIKDPYYDEEEDKEGVSFQEYLGDEKNGK